jgi:hypothetical protein
MYTYIYIYNIDTHTYKYIYIYHYIPMIVLNIMKSCCDLMGLIARLEAFFEAATSSLSYLVVCKTTKATKGD